VSGAAIYSLGDGTRVKDDTSAWDHFSSPSNTAEFCSSWLAILCAQIEHVSAALLVLGPDKDGGFGAAAVWPDATRNVKYLGLAAEKALTERCGIVDRVVKERRRVIEHVAKERRGTASGRGATPPSAHIGYPIEVSGVLYGAVILDIADLQDQQLQRALRLLHWGSAWLIDWFRQQLVAEQKKTVARLTAASEAVATALQEEKLGASALAVANELAERLGCDRVAIGLERSGIVQVQAISHTASFDARSDFVRLMADAMDEALDLDMSIVHPALSQDAVGGLAHAALSSARNGASVMSVPLVDDSQKVGVLTFERSGTLAFDAAELELGNMLGMLLGPIYVLKRERERGAWQRARDAARVGALALFGPRHPGFKLVVLGVALLFAFLSFATSNYRVTSRTIIEGSIQSAVVAPFQGFVMESFVRAGNTVRKGQTLARLDDRELKLERARWASEAEQTQRKVRQAAAVQDRAAMAVASAQGDQARAQLALVDERLERATLTAPFDGIVVLGDLSQLLGSPVEPGKLLFEVAPLDAYRVVLNVDERDIADVREGARGDLALSGMPHERLPFTVRQVTPISTPQDGRNYFRVEAQLDQATLRLRPGMEGIGKVEVGERKLIWIWTHPLMDWLRLWAWKWFG